jgi:dihydrofolate synthase/folylpolyglutamate synthase
VNATLSYPDALAFWYGRINYEVRAAEPADLKLEWMEALLVKLGRPHRSLPLVHVTGTKGKGSTAAMIAAALQATGRRTGLFTSPHLVQVEERIQVDGVPISHDELAARMTEVAVAVEALEVDRNAPRITFFEVCTALGFLHFVRSGCDIAVIEVGLGGRFDSTNVCRPEVAVVTNVGFDHMAQLGDTLEAIAFQKAGIVKPGVPVVVGPMDEGPRAVVRTVADELNAPVIEARTEDLDPNWIVGLPGNHQRENAACAVAALRCLKIPEAAIRSGLARTTWPARIEVVSRDPLVILDSAHNVPSAIALVRTLRESFPVRGHKSVVFAVSMDKQQEEILRILAAYFESFHFTKYGINPRSADPAKLAEMMEQISPGKSVHIHSTSADAWRAARSAAGRDDLVCITGSVFLAGELNAAVRTGFGR